MEEGDAPHHDAVLQHAVVILVVADRRALENQRGHRGGVGGVGACAPRRRCGSRAQWMTVVSTSGSISAILSYLYTEIGQSSFSGAVARASSIEAAGLLTTNTRPICNGTIAERDTQPGRRRRTSTRSRTIRLRTHFPPRTAGNLTAHQHRARPDPKE
jgi:hypothetical protein